MRGVVSGFFSSGVSSDEFFAEACVALHSAAMRYDLGQSEVTFGLYAKTCVYNRMIDLVRVSGHMSQVVSGEVECEFEEESVESGIVERESIEKIMEFARTELSDYEYRVFMLHIQGYKTASIAKLLSKTPKSVDNAKFRLFKRLRSLVD